MSEIDDIIWENALSLAARIHGWDKDELAKKMKVPITSLNSIANGTRGIGKVMGKKMADAIGVSVRDLLRGDVYIASQPHTIIPSECGIACNPEFAEICKKVKEIYDADSDWWNSLKFNIDSFKKGVELEEGSGGKKSKKRKGRSTGTTKKPARSTGLKRKAG